MDVERAALEAFRRFCDLPDAERAAAVAGLPDPVRARVQALFAHDAAASALDAPALGRLARRLGDDLARRDLDADARDALPGPGDRVGRYTILRVVGAGGMGVVFEARQDHPDRRVALKTVHPFLRDEATLARFDAEIRLLGGLLHPAIPQAYEAFVDEGVPWLSMELVEGAPVDRATGAWGERRLVELLAEVGEAVHHAAGRGVVHGDIQPGNVLVTADGRPKLLDFGLAASLGDDPAGLRGDTRGFLSPGRVRDGGGPLDTRSDVYALGQLGRALIGRPHPDVLAILARATAPDRADRYADARAFSEDCRRYLAHEPVRARPPTAIYRLERFARRHRALLVTAAASLGLGTAVWGGTAWSEMRARQGMIVRDAERVAIEVDAASALPPDAPAWTPAAHPVAAARGRCVGLAAGRRGAGQGVQGHDAERRSAATSSSSRGCGRPRRRRGRGGGGVGPGQAPAAMV